MSYLLGKLNMCIYIHIFSFTNGSWRHWRDISITRTKNEESKNNVISNYIYKDLIKQRYKDILNFMLEHYTSKSRLCDLSFPYTEAYYKTYLIIEYEDGRIFIY